MSKITASGEFRGIANAGFAAFVALSLLVLAVLAIAPAQIGMGNLAAGSVGGLLILIPGVILCLFAATVAGIGVTSAGYDMLALLVFFCAGIPALDENPIHLPGFKLYLPDLIGAILAVHAGFLFLNSEPGKLPGRAPRFIYWPLTIFIIMGGLQAFRALALGIQYQDALGDFRRGFFYLIIFFYPFLLRDRMKAARYIIGGMLAASLFIISKAGLQIVFQNFDRRMALDAAHVLTHNEGVLLTFALFYATMRLAIVNGENGGQNTKGGSFFKNIPQSGWLLLFVLSGAAIFLTNFRAVWLSAMIGAGAVTLLLPVRHQFRLLVAGIFAGTALLILLAFAWTLPVGDSGQTIGDEIMLKLDKTKNFDRDTNLVWRVQSYEAALNAWRTSPILGTGLGSKNSFFVFGSDWSVKVAERHRTHNGYLWILQTTGVVGLLALLYLHFSFLRGWWRGARASLRDRGLPDPLLVAIFGFHVAFLVAASFDVIIEQSTTIITAMSLFAAGWIVLEDILDRRTARDAAALTQEVNQN